MCRTGAIISACAALALLLCIPSCKQEEQDGREALTCAISLNGRELSGASLLCGYNHFLLNRFASATGSKAAIRLAGSKESLLDSLRSGSLDVVSFPYIDSLSQDSTLLAISVDSCGLWVFSAQESRAERASEWLEEYRSSEAYASLRQPYFDIYSPSKRDSASFISPYDSLIRAWADTLGWDWHMLAALIYKESRFHIEARSQMGAEGLMQLRPRTSRLFGCTDALDPAQNISAGVKLLVSLRSRYSKMASGEELTKYTLAAYNAGTGRIKDCISHARHLGVDVSRWENVAEVIPQMQDDSIAALGHISLGKFNGRETVSFVRQVYSYSNRYRQICP